MTRQLVALFGIMALSVLTPARAQIERCIEGDKAAQSDNFAAAVEHFTACLENAGLTTASKARALLNRALAYGELKQWSRALEDQKAGLALELLVVLFELALLLFELGELGLVVQEPLEALGEFGSVVYPEHNISDSSPGPNYAHGVLADFMYRRSTTIYGGTNEIQRTIIAKSFLGL